MSSTDAAGGTLSWRPIEATRSLRRTLRVFRHGGHDPTTRLTDTSFTRAALTPAGPGTLLLRWHADPADPADCGLSADAWGPGAEWLLDRVDDLTGRGDRPVVFDGAHPVVDNALRLTRQRRIGASGDAYHQLLPTILAQRITAGEAIRQWGRLCRALGESAPGPADIAGGVVLPPSPASLHRRPAWWFHPLGIESKRARTLVEVARYADRLWEWTAAGSEALGSKLALLDGIGHWTIGSVLGPVCGDPDAIPIGDFHFPSTVSWALAGESRADDDRMLELLRPYRGQRGRVLSAIVTSAGKAPAFGPRRRVLPIARW